MNIKERMMAIILGDEPDEIPLGIYSILLLRGAEERELRNEGVALISWIPVHKINVRNAKLIKSTNYAPWSTLDRFLPSNVQFDIEETYHTTKGEISLKNRTGLNFVGGHWTFEPLIKQPADYSLVANLVENTEVSGEYKGFLDEEKRMGSDGIVYACGPKSPLQEMIMLMGYRNFSLGYYRNRAQFDELYKVLFDKILEEYDIIAESPAQMVWGGENLDGKVTNPTMFEKYNMPFYERVTSILHRKSKVLATHFDGRLKCLRDLIGKTDIDVIEAFVPPPMGDLPIREAREAWGEKRVVMISFPGSAAMLGKKAIEEQTLSILKAIAPGDRAEIQICEDLPMDIVYTTLKTIMRTIRKHGRYPMRF